MHPSALLQAFLRPRLSVRNDFCHLLKRTSAHVRMQRQEDDLSQQFSALPRFEVQTIFQGLNRREALPLRGVKAAVPERCNERGRIRRPHWKDPVGMRLDISPRAGNPVCQKATQLASSFGFVLPMAVPPANPIGEERQERSGRTLSQLHEKIASREISDRPVDKPIRILAESSTNSKQRAIDGAARNRMESRVFQRSPQE